MSTSDSITILLVDDNPHDRGLVKRELERAFSNLTLLEAVEQRDFDHYLSQGCFDLVVTDYHLKWSDGIKVLQAVKRLMPHVPVIMFTGTGSEEIAVEAMKHGLDDYIIKNVRHLVRLQAAVKASLEHAGVRRRAERLASQLQSILSSIRVGVFSLAANGMLIDANRVMLELLGSDHPSHVPPHRIAELLPSASMWHEFLARVQQSHGTEELEFPHEDRLGHQRWYRLALRRVVSEDGSTRLDGLVEDITRRRQEREAAEIRAVAKAQIDMLSPREHDVLKGILDGLPNKTIARRLDISEKTVEKHRSSLMRKLRVRSVAELVRLAVTAGAHDADREIPRSDSPALGEYDS
ncbi:MAG: hypothetical protein KatS3mg111_0036 [Pirellulaceae bacterium]|nr:MAG: hypothetical protein KatS3mg111_0036 [Pirellulaceae bacterium]